MSYKFEQLEVWTRALEYIDRIHEIADQLPKHERYNLGDQMTRAANSIALNIAPQEHFLTAFGAPKGPRG